ASTTSRSPPCSRTGCRTASANSAAASIPWSSLTATAAPAAPCCSATATAAPSRSRSWRRCWRSGSTTN
ncbi:hypothetical protein TSOC_006099, partial [Tetrabaena socialis]